MSELYAINTTPEGYRVIKCDDDDRLTFYNLTQRRGWVGCECFAANKHTCRHREMVTLYQQQGRLDKGWLYNYTEGEWIKPSK